MKTSWLIKAQNRCNSLNKKAKNTYFKKATENAIIGSKKFWSTVKPILSSKGFIHNNNTSIETDNKIIEDEPESTKQFNSHYINIVKSTTGKHPTKLQTLASRVTITGKLMQLSLANSKIIRVLKVLKINFHQLQN